MKKIPILDRKCPKCGFLTLAEFGDLEICYSSNKCDYFKKIKGINNEYIYDDREYRNREID